DLHAAFLGEANGDGSTQRGRKVLWRDDREQALNHAVGSLAERFNIKPAGRSPTLVRPEKRPPMPGSCGSIGIARHSQRSRKPLAVLPRGSVRPRNNF